VRIPHRSGFQQELVSDRWGYN